MSCLCFPLCLLDPWFRRRHPRTPEDHHGLTSERSSNSNVVTTGWDLDCVNELWRLMAFCSWLISFHWPCRAVEVGLYRLMDRKGQVVLRVPLDQLVLGNQDFLLHHVLHFCHLCRCQEHLVHLRQRHQKKVKVNKAWVMWVLLSEWI